MSKKNTLKILEWNVNSRSTGATIPDYVPDEILCKTPDIVILVEFKGINNKLLIEKKLTNYNVYVSMAIPTRSNNKNSGNSILIALSKDTFPNPIEDKNISWKQAYDYNIPDWIKIHTKWNDRPLDIIGIKVLVAGKQKQKIDLQSRKKQIQWILNKNRNSKTNMIIGDFNFGPDKTSYEANLKINWQDIIQVMRDSKYLQDQFNSDTHSPYCPSGFSYRSLRSDWLIGKGISVIRNSVYNNLDWSFGKYHNNKFTNGYISADGYFILNDPPYPDHAIFTVEIKLQ